MTELEQQMLDVVTAAGNEITWDAFVSALPPQSRSQIPRAFARLRSEGLLSRRSEYTTESGLTPLMVRKV